MEINELQPNEKQRLFIQNFLGQESQPSSLAFCQRFKSRQRHRKAAEETTEKLQVCLDWRQLAWRSCRGNVWKLGHRKQDGDMWWVRILRRLPFATVRVWRASVRNVCKQVIMRYALWQSHSEVVMEKK